MQYYKLFVFAANAAENRYCIGKAIRRVETNYAEWGLLLYK
jgi:hypothetical protein